MRPTQFLSLALLSTTISAWSLDSITENKAIQGIEHLFVRADASSSDPNAPTATESSAKSTNSDSSAQSSSGGSSAAATSSGSKASSAASSGASSGAATSDASSKGSASASGSSSGSASASGSGSSGSAKSTDKSSSGKSSGTKSASTKTYGNSVGYGGASMITPNVYSSSSYYKIGEYVTFAWNFTSLSVTPTAIDILASCAANSHMYTIAMNQSVASGAKATGAVTWDTGATGTVPLLTETYTLVIHDAALDVTATPSYGHLSAYTQHVFAMYTPQSYTALAKGFQCVTCNAGTTAMERQTVGFIFAMAAVTIASFTLFAGNFGVL